VSPLHALTLRYARVGTPELTILCPSTDLGGRSASRADVSCPAALAAALRSVRDQASDALEEVEEGRACFAQLVDVLAAIAEDAAAGLADVTTVQRAD
jgi:hypothetical protein